MLENQNLDMYADELVLENYVHEGGSRQWWATLRAAKLLASRDNRFSVHACQPYRPERKLRAMSSCARCDPECKLCEEFKIKKKPSTWQCLESDFREVAYENIPNRHLPWNRYMRFIMSSDATDGATLRLSLTRRESVFKRSFFRGIAFNVLQNFWFI